MALCTRYTFNSYYKLYIMDKDEKRRTNKIMETSSLVLIRLICVRRAAFSEWWRKKEEKPHLSVLETLNVRWR